MQLFSLYKFYRLMVRIKEQCLPVFKQLKYNQAYRYIVYKIEDDMIIDRLGQRQQTWSQFISKLPKNQPRFAVYSLQFTTNDGIKQNKVINIRWMPDSVTIKWKEAYRQQSEYFDQYLDISGKRQNYISSDDYTQEDLIKVNLRKELNLINE